MKATAGHRAEMPKTVMLARLVLVVGVVLALAAAFGPIWAARVGVALAVVAGVVACVLLARMLRDARRSAGERLVAQSRAHGEALHAERRDHAEVLQVLSGRLGDVKASLATSQQALARRQRELATVRSELATQRGDNVALRVELNQRAAALVRVRDELAGREAELADLSRTDPSTPTQDAEVVSLPRRGVSSLAQAAAVARRASGWGTLPTAEDLWTDGDHPTVADLHCIDADILFGAPPRARQA